MKNITRFIASIIICEGAGVIGAIFTTPAISTWYSALKKPEFSPPNQIFSPFWITIFFLMGISLFLVWQKKFTDKTGAHVKDADMVFILQLLLNIFWSIIFFGLKSPGFAFLEIIFLWLAILITMAKFLKISKLSAWLFLPYILWVTFAGILNFAIWQIN